MCIAQCLAQRFLAPRHGKQMDVIRHQAISPNGQPSFSGVLFQEAQIRRAIRINLEYIRPAVSPLYDVMGKTRDHYACNTAHGEEIHEARRDNQINP